MLNTMSIMCGINMEIAIYNCRYDYAPSNNAKVSSDGPKSIHCTYLSPVLNENDSTPLGLNKNPVILCPRAAPWAIDRAPLGLRGGYYLLRGFHPRQKNIFSFPFKSHFSQNTFSPEGVSSIAQGAALGYMGNIDKSPNGAKSIRPTCSSSISFHNK